jgi:uncharacterized protein YbaP (TraB family)
MRQRWIKPLFLLVLLLIFSLYVFETSSQEQKSFLWKVQSRRNKVYLLGSIHLLKKEIYPLQRKIEEAFDRSAVLVVEADVNRLDSKFLQKLMETAFYPENETLESHISPETFLLIKKEFAETGFPLELIQKQKPWFLALTISALSYVKMGFDPTYGIDMYFLSKAEGKKKILELESLEEQLQFLSQLSDREQESLLSYELKSKNFIEKETNQLVKAWLAGDVRGIESILNRGIRQDPRLSSVYEKMIDERNRKMVLRIEEFLGTGEDYFVIVGAGHLVGDQGIPEILRRKGYSVEQL